MQMSSRWSMISKKNTMSVCNCIRELLEESYTCGRAALGGGGGGGAAGGGGGGGGGTGMPRPQIPGEDKAHSIAGNPVCSASRFFICSASEEATVYWVHSMTCHPLPLNRKSFHHHTAQNRKQQSAPSSPEKSDTSPPFPTMPHGRLLQARTMESVV